MSYEFYKILHLAGIFLLLIGTTGMVVKKYMLAESWQLNPALRKIFGMFHGLGLLISLVGGFGLLARLQLGWPSWVFGKVAIWLLLGASPVALRFLSPVAMMLLVPIIAVVGALLAVLKPM